MNQNVIKYFFFILATVFSLYMAVGATADILITERFELSENLPADSVRGPDNNWYRNGIGLDASIDFENLRTYYPMLNKNSTLNYVLSLMCFGILGSIIRILLTLYSTKKSLSDLKVYVGLTLGTLIGLLIIVLSEIIPEFKYETGNYKMFYSLALIGGLYSFEFMKWLGDRFDHFYPAKSNGEKKDG